MLLTTLWRLDRMDNGQYMVDNSRHNCPLGGGTVRGFEWHAKDHAGTIHRGVGSSYEQAEGMAERAAAQGTVAESAPVAKSATTA